MMFSICAHLFLIEIVQSVDHGGRSSAKEIISLKYFTINKSFDDLLDTGHCILAIGTKQRNELLQATNLPSIKANSFIKLNLQD